MHCFLTHSNYSFLQGASSPQEIIDTASKAGLDGIALTDFDGFYGLVKGFLAKKSLKNDFKLFYGVEVLMDFDCESESKLPLDKTPVFLQNRLCFIATSLSSYAQIAALVSYAHRNGKTPTPILANDAEAPWPTEGLVILPQRGMSQCFSPNETGKFQKWAEGLKLLSGRYQGSFYLALTPPSSPFERNAYENHLALHETNHIPLLATGDVFFHNSERKILHNFLCSIRANITLEDNEFSCFLNAERKVHGPGFYKNFFQRSVKLRTAFENNAIAADKIKFCLSEIAYSYPQEFIPEGLTSIEYLCQVVADAVDKQYKNSASGIPDRMADLLKKELCLVEELGFADYFLTVFDIVRYAREELKILCQGRGSAANSAICYILGITPVDPMSSDVLFERFISRERGEPPDIDVDFEHERREEVIQYIYKRYGENRAAMVANVITFRTKGSYRSIGKALGLSEEIITKLSQEIRAYPEKSREYRNFSTALEAAKEVGNAAVESWFKYAELLRGFPRHLGIHSGGFVISNTSLFSVSPIEPATMDGRYIIQWNKDDLEEMGLFKIDVLSLGMLTALRKTYQYLRAHRKTIPGTLLPVTPRSLPFECKRTYKLLGEGRTTGTFQVESRAQMAMLPRMIPKNFYDIVLCISLVRPGPISGGMVHPYLLRRKGLQKIEFADERLKPILERTLGVPIFQEQVMRVAIAVGNFSPGEADQLRRAMGVWKMSGNMGEMGNKLLKGMRENGIKEEFAQQIFKQIHGFAEYGFPESHATSFAFLAWASCYLKTHFPNYFLCGLLNSQPLGFYSVHSLLQEGKHAGLKFFPPCILESQWDSFVNLDGSLRLGLNILNGINKENTELFLTHREKMKDEKNGYNSLSLDKVIEILEPLHANEKISLVMANTFHMYDKNRLNVLWYFLGGPGYIFTDSEFEDKFPRRHSLETLSEDVEDDFERMSTSLESHPFELLKSHGWPFEIPVQSLTVASKVSALAHGKTVFIGGLVMIRQSPPTAKGMIFITVEDETGTVNLVVRPDVYQKFRELAYSSSLLCVQGVKQSNGTQSSVLVERFFDMQFLKKKKDREKGERTEKIADEKISSPVKNQPRDLFSQ